MVLEHLSRNYLDKIGLSPDYQAVVLEVEAIAKRILSFLPRSLQEYPEHGVAHSENLFGLFQNFLDNFGQNIFSEEEKLLICLAIWLHDIGCILGRERHSENSVRLLREIKEFRSLGARIGDSLFECLKYVIMSHSSWYDLSNIPTHPIHPKVNLLKVCAVFRLLDGCDLSSERIKVIYEILEKYGLLSENSKKFWKAHLEIVSVIFRDNTVIINCKNQGSAEPLIKHFKDELDKINNAFHKANLPKLEVEIVELDFPLEE